jgi:hypothetical protein
MRARTLTIPTSKAYPDVCVLPGSIRPLKSRQVPHDWQFPPFSMFPSTRIVRGHGSPVGVA